MKIISKLHTLKEGAIRTYHKLQIWRDYFLYIKAAKESHTIIPRLKDTRFIPNNNTINTNFDRHYVYFPAWAIRVIKKNNPKKHIDISSSLTFVSMVSAYVKTEFYDYRPAKLKLSGLKSRFANINKLPFKSNSIQSLSCMHVLEHIGLGRYGEALDSEGDLKAINELIRVLEPNGNLLFVVPIGGVAKIMFNAHRIYTYSQIISYFDKLKLVEFVLIPEKNKDGGLVKNPSKKLLRAQNYACGCFWFKKQ